MRFAPQTHAAKFTVAQRSSQLPRGRAQHLWRGAGTPARGAWRHGAGAPALRARSSPQADMCRQRRGPGACAAGIHALHGCERGRRVLQRQARRACRPATPPPAQCPRQRVRTAPASAGGAQRAPALCARLPSWWAWKAAGAKCPCCHCRCSQRCWQRRPRQTRQWAALARPQCLTTWLRQGKAGPSTRQARQGAPSGHGQLPLAQAPAPRPPPTLPPQRPAGRARGGPLWRWGGRWPGPALPAPRPALPGAAAAAAAAAARRRPWAPLPRRALPGAAAAAAAAARRCWWAPRTRRALPGAAAAAAVAAPRGWPRPRRAPQCKCQFAGRAAGCARKTPRLASNAHFRHL